MGAGIELAAGRGADVHQHIAAFGDAIDEHLHEQFGRLPVQIVTVVAPGAVEGLAGFPVYGLAVHVQPTGRDELLGGVEILLEFAAVIDDDIGLQFAHHPDEFLTLPVVFALAFAPAIVLLGVGEVEPQEIDGAEVGEDFAYLAVEVLGILAHVTVFGRLPEREVVCLGMHAVYGKLRVMPVDERIVEADLESLGAESLYEMAARGRAGRGYSWPCNR